MEKTYDSRDFDRKKSRIFDSKENRSFDMIDMRMPNRLVSLTAFKN